MKTLSPLQISPRHLSPRHLSLLYLVYFLSLGIAVPYVPVAMRRIGFTGDEIGAAMAVGLALYVATPPVWGWFADRAGGGGRQLVAAAVGSAAGMVLAAVLPGKLGFALGLLVYACMRTPVSPLLDALTLAHPAIGREGFGRVRRWGSVGFVLGAFVTGLFVDRLGAGQIVGLVALQWVLLVALALAMGLHRAVPAPPVALAPRRLYGEPRVWAFLAVSAVHAGCGVPYDTYFAIHAADVGLAGHWVGTAWGLGVTVEVLVLTHLEGMVQRFGPKRILLAAYATGLLRWALTAAIPGGVPLALVQAVHGVSFGAFFGASVVWLDRVVPAELRASAQSVFAAVVWGGGGIVAQLIAGPVYGHFGGRALFAGAAVTEVVPLLALALLLSEPPAEKSLTRD